MDLSGAPVISTILGIPPGQQKPTPLITLSQLVNMNSTLTAIETSNKASLETTDTALLITNLQKWAASGFQESYTVYEFTIVPSQKEGNTYKCSDGVSRTIWDYIPFFLGYSIQELVANLQAQIEDIKLSFSVQEDPTMLIRIHASK